MWGDPWDHLSNAFKQFLDQRLRDQSTTDLVSVIQFDDSARQVMQRVPLQADLELLECNEGNTAFLPPLNMACDILSNREATELPVLIFMSDGDGHDDPRFVMEKMWEMAEQYRPLSVHTVAFGEHACVDRLQVLLLLMLLWKLMNALLFRKWPPRQMEYFMRRLEMQICQEFSRTLQ